MQFGFNHRYADMSLNGSDYYANFLSFRFFNNINNLLVKLLWIHPARFCNCLSSQGHTVLETTDSKRRVLLDRRFNMCNLFKSKKLFQHSKALLQSRVNMTIACPFKKGSYWLDLEYRTEDLVKLVLSGGEVRHFLPTLTASNIANSRFNFHSTLLTRIDNVMTPLLTLNFTDFGISEVLSFGNVWLLLMGYSELKAKNFQRKSIRIFH